MSDRTMWGMPRWLLLAVDVVASLSLAYMIGLWFWVVAHPAAYNGLPSMPTDVKVWLYNLPLALLGILWLAVRFSLSPWHRDRYPALEARYPNLMLFGPVIVALLGGGLVIWILSRF